MAGTSAFGGVTAYAFGGQLFVAANTSTGSIVVRRYNVNLNGTLALVSPTWTFAGFEVVDLGATYYWTGDCERSPRQPRLALTGIGP